jgi:hypothetical protein
MTVETYIVRKLSNYADCFTVNAEDRNEAAHAALATLGYEVDEQTDEAYQQEEEAQSHPDMNEWAKKYDDLNGAPEGPDDH